MKVLVTGASGLLGGGVARVLAARGDDVTVMQRRPSGLRLREVVGDVTDERAVRRAVAGQDAVVHLAAKVNVVGAPVDYEAVNVGGTRHVLAACAGEGTPRLVHVSSPSVAHAGHSLVGAGADPADPDRARGPYARTKATAELLALAADDGGRGATAVVALRPHLVWGPGDTQLVARVVARAHARRLPIIGTGAPLIDTTYLTNAVDALVAALDRCRSARGRAYVVTNGQPRPVAEILTRFAAAGGAPGPRRRVPVGLALVAGAAGEVAAAVRERRGTLDPADPPLTRFLVEQLSTAHWFDQRATRAALAWKPRVTLDEGFVELGRWYRDRRARPAHG